MKHINIFLLLILLISYAHGARDYLKTSEGNGYPKKLLAYIENYRAETEADPYILANSDRNDITAGDNSKIFDFIANQDNDAYIKYYGKTINYNEFISSGIKALLVGETHNFDLEKEVVKIVENFKKHRHMPYFASEFMASDANDLIALCQSSGDKNILNGKQVRKEVKPFIEEFSELKIIGLEPPEIFNAPFPFVCDYSRAVLYYRAKADDDVRLAVLSPEAVAYRNRHWVKMLTPYLSDNNIIVVYGGAGHMFYGDPSGSIADRLMGQNINTAVMFLLSKKQFKTKGGEYKNLEKKFSKGKAVVKIPDSEKKIFPFDYLVITD
ncbi:hypothetical protein Emin_0430 [Elusimicrobium minutum Pei191]|uniref:Haem-binding uptake Tiki superfamily ChaN domain-containing protein n=1 Tax=Elusimicrobium minutum (strain Pei191) TaxID=445932 RepID=B2KBG5_ELUMP|nr:hypothetical protein [Elusimicrobium minutum]ACC97987.1 hypothetical protein Emin_0430 [Elusimicrobium minutum Pei191]